MNRFFDELGARWVEAGRRRGLRIEAPTLDSDVALELLELARVTAHTQERRFAPLSSYLAGIAAERIRSANPGTNSAAIAELIREVRTELEEESPPQSSL